MSLLSSLTLTRSHSLAHTHSLTLTRPHSLAHTHSRSHSLAHTHKLFPFPIPLPSMTLALRPKLAQKSPYPPRLMHPSTNGIRHTCVCTPPCHALGKKFFSATRGFFAAPMRWRRGCYGRRAIFRWRRRLGRRGCCRATVLAMKLPFRGKVDQTEGVRRCPGASAGARQSFAEGRTVRRWPMKCWHRICLESHAVSQIEQSSTPISSLCYHGEDTAGIDVEMHIDARASSWRVGDPVKLKRSDRYTQAICQKRRCANDNEPLLVDDCCESLLSRGRQVCATLNEREEKGAAFRIQWVTKVDTERREFAMRRKLKSLKVVMGRR